MIIDDKEGHELENSEEGHMGEFGGSKGEIIYYNLKKVI